MIALVGKIVVKTNNYSYPLLNKYYMFDKKI